MPIVLSGSVYGRGDKTSAPNKTQSSLSLLEVSRQEYKQIKKKNCTFQSVLEGSRSSPSQCFCKGKNLRSAKLNLLQSNIKSM